MSFVAFVCLIQVYRQLSRFLRLFFSTKPVKNFTVYQSRHHHHHQPDNQNSSRRRGHKVVKAYIHTQTSRHTPPHWSIISCFSLAWQLVSINWVRRRKIVPTIDAFVCLCVCVVCAYLFYNSFWSLKTSFPQKITGFTVVNVCNEEYRWLPIVFVFVKPGVSRFVTNLVHL